MRFAFFLFRQNSKLHRMENELKAAQLRKDPGIEHMYLIYLIEIILLLI